MAGSDDRPRQWRGAGGVVLGARDPLLPPGLLRLAAVPRQFVGPGRDDAIGDVWQDFQSITRDRGVRRHAALAARAWSVAGLAVRVPAGDGDRRRLAAPRG